MTKVIKSLGCVAVMMLGISATHVAKAEEGYGTAGCGLGSLLFGQKKGFVQIFAATTNSSFGTQTFGITTGTSNCKETGGGSASAQAFVQTNRQTFTKDAAKGQGETISSLSSLAGCQDAKAVGAVLQKDFKSIVPNANASDVEVSKSTVDTLKAHPELACRKLS